MQIPFVFVIFEANVVRKPLRQSKLVNGKDSRLERLGFIILSDFRLCFED